MIAHANDPTWVADGIQLSDDPIPHFRAHVDADSVRRRTDGHS